MKKLLEILGTVTIVGSGISGIVANKPHLAQEQKTKLVSSEIHYLQTNNLESLIRNKRENNNEININDIKFSIAEWKHINNNDAIFVRTTNGEVYYLNGLRKWKYNIPYPVTAIYRFEKDGFGRSAGDVYFGTTNGIYLSTAQNNWINPSKINGIDEEIVSIQTDRGHENSVHIKTISGKACFMDANGTIGWYNIPYPVTAIYRFEKGGFGRSAGDVYFGTTNGIYLSTAQNNWINPSKINGIDEEIVSIQTDRGHENSVHIKTISGKACFMDANGTIGWYNIPYPVTAIYRFEKGGFGRSAGDVYFGTTNGIYLSTAQNNWINPSKINGINIGITEIDHINGNGAVFVRTINGEVYYVNGLGKWKYNIPYPVTAIYRFEKVGYGRNVGDVYFGTTNGIYLVKMGSWTAEKHLLNDFIKINFINQLNNVNNISILNELNYLNPNLDISQLEIAEKENNSFLVKARTDSNKYIGEKKIYYTINNQQNKIINLNELIKKGIFLSFRDKNQGITIKEIKNINTNNLIYSNVTATKNIEPIYNKNSKSICFGTTTLFHNLAEKQKMKTPNCKYTKETTINSQITTGLSRTEGEEKNTEQSYISSMEHNWNIELSASATVWPFAEASATAGTGGSYSSSSTKTSSETKTLSNTFDFSSNKTNEYKEVSEVELPSQEIEVNPNQKIKVTASLDEVLAQVTLKLTQNIYGNITSQITNTSNEEKSFEILIKEIMQKLKEYNLLPQEIIINNDDSITFNGSAHRSLKQGFDGNIEFHEVK
ncbi:ETX/MTX2 family pore-forming toxin [Spiroplasma endosymbiont of Nephrotoma flavescens]|uniref:ETX/MTX2 family pore-forming toxin n=1 Tax=Spiroplasma endosymbiont of Nephrotoma flavescens TaxID=3066302 RepID=UPI00313E9983